MKIDDYEHDFVLYDVMFEIEDVGMIVGVSSGVMFITGNLHVDLHVGNAYITFNHYECHVRSI
jgi:hypothetical protein